MTSLRAARQDQKTQARLWVWSASWVLLAMLFAGCGATSSSQHAFPTPGPGRTPYANALYKYTIIYPSDWHLVTENDGAIALALFTTNIAIPNAIAFQIKAAANPDKLDAAAWWQQNQPADGIESGRGSFATTNGAIGFVASGQGQRPYTVYTFARDTAVCQILVPQSDEANTKIAQAVAKTFAWT